MSSPTPSARSAPSAPAFAVESHRRVNARSFVLRFSRNGLSFQPGQYLSVGLAGAIDAREYSIYSSPGDTSIEILVKEIDSGLVSRQLAAAEPGARLRVDGPFGFFTVDEDWRDNRFVLIATGTGISPFHCFASTYPGLDYLLLHGIRTEEDRCEYEAFTGGRLVSCTTGDASGDFHGRVTDYLRGNPETIDSTARYYLCGNCDMIYEVFDILQDEGVPHNHLFAEVYF
jgi:ferredoxin/flavodoxin---NADP+ reductase